MTERTRKNLNQLTAEDFYPEIELATTKTRVIMKALGVENIIWNKNYSSIEDSISKKVESCLEQLKESDLAFTHSGFSVCEMRIEDNQIYIDLYFPLV